MLTREIIVNGNPAGQVVICYLEERQASDEGLFMIDERHLLNAVAERLGRIIERKRAEESLVESKERFRTIIHSIQFGIVIIDAKTHTILDANDKALEMIGSCNDIVVGSVCHRFICPAELGKCPVTDLGQNVDSSERVLLNLAGDKIPIIKSVIKTTLGGRAVLIESFVDITERKLAEAYRQLSADVLGILNEPAELHEMIRRVLNAIKQGTNADAVGIRLKADDDFPYFVANGFSDEFLITENTLVARDQNGGICRDSEGNVSLECTCGLIISQKTDPKNPLFTTGGSFWTNNSLPLLDLPAEQDPRYHPRNICIHEGYASFALIPMRTSQQQIMGILQINAVKKNCFTLGAIQSLELIAGSISEALVRRTAEDALRGTNEYLNNLFDYANAPIIVWDPEYVITRFNHAFEDMTLRSEQEVIGQRLDILFPKESRETSLIQIKKTLEGERWETVEIPILVNDGSVRTVLWNSANILDYEGRIISTIAQGVDITVRKALEDQIAVRSIEISQISTAFQHANKKLNLLSSITRHDINNQLTAMVLYLSLAEEEDSVSTIREHLKKIGQITRQIQKQIQFTKDYEEIGVAAPAWQDTHTIVQTAAKETPLGQITMINDLPPGTEVFADPLIARVFYNLMNNAVRYGVKCTTIRFFVLGRSDDQVIVCEDDGVGVPAEEKEKIFKRGLGTNTGFGLFLAREILDITGITIRETGEPGKGARFEIAVPKGAWRRCTTT